MVNLFIGAGQAGGSLLNTMFDYKNVRNFAKPIAINSTAKDLANLKRIRKSERWGVSKEEGLISGDTKGFEEKVTGGFGKNPVKAAEVMELNYNALVDVLADQIKSSEESSIKKKIKDVSKSKSEDEDSEADKDVPMTKVTPFAFIFVGLGGGTGSGITPFIAKALKEEFDIPTIIVGILPAKVTSSSADEMETGDRQAWNAWRCINEVMPYADSFILVDNQLISYAPNIENMYTPYNTYIGRAILDLTSGALLEKIDMSKFDFNAPVLDINDLISATSFSDDAMKKNVPGFSVLGRASIVVRNLINYLVPIGGYNQVDSLTLVKVAFEKLSVSEVDPKKAEKNLVLLRVPPEYLKDQTKLDTKFLRDFMMQHTTLNEVHEGISITNRNLVSLTTLLTYRPDSLPRLKTIERDAKAYEETAKDLMGSYNEIIKFGA